VIEHATGGSGKRREAELADGVCVAGILPAIRGQDALDIAIGKLTLAAATPTHLQSGILADRKSAQTPG
jgi:hypothetical protein